ncbi:hypothetical protein GCM10011571_04720 [Marinithermofilum abyssi]|uniref:Aminoglycoside phosphotransferase domain-containing protein n=1 Tax=Marinithermofilum abyssi TaxID=1571185 RepID=A0A8J2VE79_9BACL|nr:hypothetical protein GCM10011571_04720 [Marinithermofilum abyssi]
MANQVFGLFDFENASLGDPVSDLAKLTWSDLNLTDKVLQESYLLGYEAEAGRTVDRHLLILYQVISGVDTIYWVDKQESLSQENKTFREKGLQILLYACTQLRQS